MRDERWGRAAASLLIPALLAACGTAPKAPSAPSPVPHPSSRFDTDGPPETIPDNLASIPDAVPRDEPFHRFANRPYTVFGQTYVPVVNKQPTKERGIASWYGRKFHGQKTASGETYDMFAMTAAHKTMPIPSYARVTNVRNGKSVVVRINDRGPFHANRIIDLSYAAAERIGIVAAGAAMVEVQRLLPGAEGEVLASASTPAPARSATVETPLVAQEAAGLWLQLGAFSSAEAAEGFRDRVAREMPWLLEPVSISSRDGLHRVRLGPYRNAQEAEAIGDKVRRSVGLTPVLTPR
ncbi:MAG TPA: septal ring lytic transglycosylase RlpA family protein [Usitatibacter sp.]|nr:septal ring lytic transglycosylase RlpA family protein [Usitatibacter sp.]